MLLFIFCSNIVLDLPALYCFLTIRSMKFPFQSNSFHLLEMFLFLPPPVRPVLPKPIQAMLAA